MQIVIMSKKIFLDLRNEYILRRIPLIRDDVQMKTFSNCKSQP